MYFVYLSRKYEGFSRKVNAIGILRLLKIFGVQNVNTISNIVGIIHNKFVSLYKYLYICRPYLFCVTINQIICSFRNKKHIRIRFKELYIDGTVAGHCSYNGLLLSDGKSPEGPYLGGGYLCGDHIPGDMVSTHANITMQLNIDKKTSLYPRRYYLALLQETDGEISIFPKLLFICRRCSIVFVGQMMQSHWKAM